MMLSVQVGVEVIRNFAQIANCTPSPNISVLPITGSTFTADYEAFSAVSPNPLLGAPFPILHHEHLNILK